MVSPIFLEKNWPPFLVIALSKVKTFFSCRLLTTPVFARRLCSVLSKFSPKKLILFGCHPSWMVSPGVVRTLPQWRHCLFLLQLYMVSECVTLEIINKRLLLLLLWTTLSLGMGTFPPGCHYPNARKWITIDIILSLGLVVGLWIGLVKFYTFKQLRTTEISGKGEGVWEGNVLHPKFGNGFITIRRRPDDIRRRSDANLSCQARSSHARPGCSVYDRRLIGSRPDTGRPRRVPSGCRRP